jgi:hypothetical protein
VALIGRMMRCSRRTPCALGAHLSTDDEKMRTWCAKEIAALRAEEEVSSRAGDAGAEGSAELVALAKELRERADRMLDDLLRESSGKWPQ